MKTLLIAASALALFAAPSANAQLLGGGAGGALGGITGGIGSATGPLGRASESIRTTTRQTARTNARTSGSQKVDRKSGSVALDRSFEGSAAAATSQMIDTPLGSADGAAGGSGHAAGSGSADAQLIGTDAIGSAAKDGVGRARETFGNARNRAGSAVEGASTRASNLTQRAGNLAGSANGAAGGQASGAGSLGKGMLAAAGSGAAAGEGAFAVAPGMPVIAPDGEKIGKVRELVSDQNGRVQEVVVKTRDGLKTLPAASLSGSGNALVMGEAAGGGNAATDEPAATE